MRENGVRVITVAVEKPDENDPSFRKFIKSLASEGDFFNARFNNLDAIIEQLVDKSCEIKPGDYSNYVREGKNMHVLN